MRAVAPCPRLHFGIQAPLRACSLQEHHPDVYPGIGQNDLWIAAVAVQTGLTLLTRNRRHFERIDGLTLLVLDS
jgi:predicted nucleic acid-binding protein